MAAFSAGMAIPSVASAQDVCGRELRVKNAIVAAVAGKSECAAITAGDLAAITRLDVRGGGGANVIASLPANSFAGLSGLQTLNLSANRFTTLPANAFAGLASLTELDLRANPMLQTLPANVFADLSELKTLYLGQTQLGMTRLPADVFAGLAKLETLEWTRIPRLSSLPNNIFAPLKRLKTLRLGGNQFSAVPANALLGLANLETLELQNNSIAVLPPNAFARLSNLKTLNLFNNPIIAVPANAFAGLAKLEKLELKGGPLSCTSPGSCANIRLQAGAFNGLSPGALKVKGMEILSAPDSLKLTPLNSDMKVEWGRVNRAHYLVRWKEVSATAFAPEAATAVAGNTYTIPGLQKGANYEVQVAAVPAAPREDRSGREIAWNAVSAQRVLQGVCGRPKPVRDKIIRKVPGNKNCADITGADLANIGGLLVLDSALMGVALSGETFAGLSGVEELRLQNNQISSLPANVFAGLTGLKKLYLGRNSLSSLSESAFADLANLEELYVGGNSLTALPANVFARLPKLKGLFLENNYIASVSANAFADLRKLQRLNLHGNRLMRLPENAFAGLGSLTYVNLGENLVNGRALPPGAFNGLALENLVLYGIRLAGKPETLTLQPAERSLRAVWSEVENSHYQLHWKPASAGEFALADRVTLAAPALTYEITGLNPKTAYDVRITALPAAGNQVSQTQTWSFTAARLSTADPPEKPLNLRVRSLQSRQLAVSWGAPASDGGSPVTAYRVRWKPLAAPAFAPDDAADVNASARAYDITGLTNDTVYEVQVGARNAVNYGGYTAAQQGTPRAGICGRTRQVREEVARLRSRAGCAAVTEADLAAVTSLNIAGKSITALTGDAFAGMTGLHTLQLQNNSLTALPENVFSGLPELLTLNLRNNRLAALPANVFARLANLRLLNAGANRLTAVPANAFAGLARLGELHLHDNRIASLPVNAFAGLRSVRTLSLQNNPVANNRAGALAPGVFNGLSPGLQVNGLALPAPPGAVRLTSRDQTLHAEWDEVAGSHYHVFWKQADAPAFAPADTAVVSAARHSITGLVNGAAYEVRVTAVPGDTAPAANSVWRSVAATATPYSPPGVPQNFRASAVNTGKLNIVWNAPAFDGGTPVTTYLLRWQPAGSSDPPNLVALAAPANTYILTGLTDGAAYDFQIAAETIAGPGAYSDVVRGVPLTGVCDRTSQVRDEIVKQAGVAGCSAVNAGHLRAVTRIILRNQNIASLTANAFAGLTRMHTLEVRDNRGLTALPANVFAGAPNLSALSLSGNQIASLPATVFSRLGKLESLYLHNNALTTLPVDVFAGKNKLTILTLRGNPLASFPVGAFNGLTPGVTQVDGFVQPAPPSGLQLAPSGAGGLRAAWQEVSGAHYQVRWKPLGAAAFAPGDAHASSGASYTITGLATGATYEVHVASVPGTPTAGSVFAVWASSVARGGPPSAPGAPQSVQVRAENPRELSVSWAAPASDGGDPVVTYRLRWKAAEAAAYAPADRAAVNADTLAYAIAGLADGGAYEVQVAAENAAIVGAYSAAVRGTVFALPDPPRDVLVTSKVARRLTVAWKQPSADGGTPVTSYHLRWKPLAEAAYAPANRAVTNASMLAHRIEGLTEGATYEVQIASQNAAGMGEYGNAVQGVVFPRRSRRANCARSPLRTAS